MVLAVDVGNTRTSLARVEGGGVRALARLPSETAAIEQGLPHLLRGLTRSQSAGGTAPPIGISCVVPELLPATLEALAPWGRVIRVTPEAVPRLPIGYRDPHQLGPDRLASAVEARHRLGAPCLVVDLGTALTIDLVDAEGALAGGVIFPGMDAARGALTGATARVGPESARAPRLIGRTTGEGVAGGLAYGFQALIEGLLDRFRAEIGGPAPAVLTGGGAGSLPERPRGITLVAPFLTLEGIARIATEGA